MTVFPIIFAISSWKMKLFSSISPILAEHLPLVIPSTAHPMFSDDANAAAKLPWPMPFIIVARLFLQAELVLRFFVVVKVEPHSVVRFLDFSLYVHCV